MLFMTIILDVGIALSSLFFSVFSIRQDHESLNGIPHCCLSSSGRFLSTTGENGYVAIWDVKAKKKIAQCQSAKLVKPSDTICSFDGFQATASTFGRNSEDVLFFCNERGLFKWNWKDGHSPKITIENVFGTASGKLPRIDLKFPVHHMSVSDDEHVMGIVQSNGTCLFVDLDRKDQPILHSIIDGIERIEEDALALAFVRKSRSVFVSRKNKVLFLDFEKRKGKPFENVVHEMSLPVAAMALSPDSNLVATGDRVGNVFVFDLADKKNRLVAKLDTRIISISFSHDSRLLAVADAKSRVTVVSTKDARTIASIQNTTLPDGYSYVGFLHDNCSLYSVGSFPGVRFLSLQEGQLREIR
jgi:WD40 repeat protein